MLKLLEQKHNKYLELLPTVQDSNGFIQFDKCDSLGFTSLLGCVPGVKVNIEAAFDAETGMWLRRPLEYPRCYPDNSKSTISRDMLLMLAWFVWKNKRLDISEQIIKYALSHWLIMGKAASLKDKIGRCVLTPGLLATWAEISYRLGGPNRWWLRYLPQAESKTVTGYQAHLTVLHCLLRKELTGKLNEVVLYHAQREPNNPLFQIAIENYTSAIDILMDSRLWPNENLPTSADRAEEWLPQRDYGLDWKASTETPIKQFSGADFLFCSSLILKELGDV